MRTLPLLLVLITAAPVGAQQTAAASAATAADSVRTYELAEVEVTPRARNYGAFERALRREYPPALREAGREGVVQVRFRVEPDGTTSSARATHATDSAFIEPTLRAVQVLRYRPARIGGRPVRVWVALPIRWQAAQRTPRERPR